MFPSFVRGLCAFALLSLYLSYYNAAAVTTAAEQPNERGTFDEAFGDHGQEAQQELQPSPEDTEVCTQNLRDALNAAISEIIGTRELTDYLLPLWDEGSSYVPVLVCSPFLPTSRAASVAWPEKSSLVADDLLSEILNRGTVVVAGIGKEVNGEMRKLHKGSAGNFTMEKPTGFFPDYLRSIWRVIGKHFGSSVSVTYKFYPSVETAEAAVAAGEADMTDIYFPVSHRNRKIVTQGDINIANPLSFLYMTCPVVGATLHIYTRNGATQSFHALINSINAAHLAQNQEDGRKRTVIVSSDELKETVAPILPEWTIIKQFENMATALNKVASGAAAAAMFMGPASSVSLPPGVSRNPKIDVVLAKGAWVRRSRSVKCLRREHIRDLSK